MKTTAIVLLSVLLVAGCEPSPSSSSVAPRPPVESTFTSIGTNAQGYAEYKHDQTGIVFVRLPGGEFEFGSPEDRNGWVNKGRPVSTVTLSPFLIAKYEVTQAEYEAVMGYNPSTHQGDDQRPVESVSCQNIGTRAGGVDLPPKNRSRFGDRICHIFWRNRHGEEASYAGADHQQAA